MRVPSINQILNGKNFLGIPVSQKQRLEIQKILDHFKMFGESRIRYQATFKLLPTLLREGVDSFILRRFLKAKYLGKGVTLRRMVTFYGKESGSKKWDEYCKRQSVTNTFEYKTSVHGMTRKEFDEYNRARASTLDNFVKRHGAEVGAVLWGEYCKRQAVAGISLDYFIEKTGSEEEGRKEYDRVKGSKSHTLENYQKRFGNERALEKLIEYYERKSCKFVSKVSQKLFWALYERLPEDLKRTVYFGELNKEFGKWNQISGSFNYYDFVISGLKYCVEFNGDYYHANPTNYQTGDEISIHGSVRKVDDIWQHDKIKNEYLESLGFRVIVVWQSDFDKDPNTTIETLLKDIETRRKDLG